MTWTAAVAGATGYAGGEVLRLLAAHPDIEIGAVTANSSAGDRLGQHHPHLPALADRLVEPTDVGRLAGHDVVVLALPHGASGAIAEAIEEAVAADAWGGPPPVLVDCGADHRLTDADAWARFYGTPYAGAWTYGMPELLHADETVAVAQRRELASTHRIAVPGCNVTAVTLAAQPGVAAGLVETSQVTAVLAVGYSGAGKSLKPHLSAAEALGCAQPYAVGGTHRHIPEIIQNLRLAGADGVRLSFTPVLVPMSRGILATVTAPVTDIVLDCEHPDEVLRSAWQVGYGTLGEGERAVRLLEKGSWPTTGAVVGSGSAAVQVAYDRAAGTATMMCAIDNLGKGTAGAAVQSLNLALGLPETTGLMTEGVAP